MGNILHVYVCVSLVASDLNPHKLSLHVDQSAFTACPASKKSAFVFIQMIIFSCLEEQVIRMSP